MPCLSVIRTKKILETAKLFWISLNCYGTFQNGSGNYRSSRHQFQEFTILRKTFFSDWSKLRKGKSELAELVISRFLTRKALEGHIIYNALCPLKNIKQRNEIIKTKIFIWNHFIPIYNLVPPIANSKFQIQNFSAWSKLRMGNSELVELVISRFSTCQMKQKNSN